MTRCCQESDSEEDSLLDTASYRRSYREIPSARRRESPRWRETMVRGNADLTQPQEQTALKNSVLDGVYAGLTGSMGLTPVENPYSPQQVSFSNVGTFSVSFPQNVYGAAISVVLNLSGECMLLWTRDVPVLFCTLISFLLQSGLTIYIAWMQFDEAVELGTCSLGGKLFVRVSCITVFTMHMLGELIELLDMHFWLNMFGYSHRHKPLKIREYSHHDGYLVNKPVTGLTYLERFLLYLLIFTPKLILALGLLIFGVPYIAYAKTNETLLLNTVALLFVAEIDEIVYKFTIPKMYRETLTVPPLGRTDEERARCFEMFVCGTLRSYVLLVILAFVVTLLYFFWCQN